MRKILAVVAILCLCGSVEAAQKQVVRTRTVTRSNVVRSNVVVQNTVVSAGSVNHAFVRTRFASHAYGYNNVVVQPAFVASVASYAAVVDPVVIQPAVVVQPSVVVQPAVVQTLAVAPLVQSYASSYSAGCSGVVGASFIGNSFVRTRTVIR